MEKSLKCVSQFGHVVESNEILSSVSWKVKHPRQQELRVSFFEL